MPAWDRTALRELLEQRLSLDELQTAAFDLEIDSEGLEKDDLARELILSTERRGQLDRLIEWLHTHRPDINTKAAVMPVVSDDDRLETPPSTKGTFVFSTVRGSTVTCRDYSL